MRNLFGKLTAMSLSLMLVLGTVTLPVSAAGGEHTVSATGTTRIEGEDYAATTHPSVEDAQLTYLSEGGAHGARIVNVSETTSTKYTVSYTLNVSAAGNYSVKAAGSLKNDDTLSDWTIYVNDASNTPSSYTAANTKFRVNGIGANGGDVYNCGGTVYLAAGENTLYWSFGKTATTNSSHARYNKIYAALDYVELTPAFTVTTVSTTEATRIEGEDASSILGGGYVRTTGTEEYSGEKALSYAPVVWTEGTEYISGFYLSVPEAGYYQINAVSSKRSQTYTSDWYIYANTSENTVSGYISIEDIATNYFSPNIQKFNCGKIYLNEGLNTIYWKVNENDHPLVNTQYVMQAVLDYIELTPVLVDISGATISAGTFTATVSKNRALPADANIYLAVYEDSSLDSVKSVYVIDAETAIGNISVSQALSLSSGNVVRLYVWYDEDHTPLCKPASVNY